MVSIAEELPGKKFARRKFVTVVVAGWRQSFGQLAGRRASSPKIDVVVVYYVSTAFSPAQVSSAFFMAPLCCIQPRPVHKVAHRAPDLCLWQDWSMLLPHRGELNGSVFF